MEPMLLIWVGVVFVLGAAVGSGLNVCIFRIPYEKSILWPGSRCGKCFQPVRWYDNIPLFSYWVLRGRCRSCGAAFSMRYFLIELFTGLAFVAVFYLDLVVNVFDIAAFRPDFLDRRIGIDRPWPIAAWKLFAAHSLLVSFLIVTTFTDLDHMEIPLTVTVTGTIVGLVLAVCFPWPWPNTLPPPSLRRGLFQPVPLGFQPWPLWRPDQLPAWLAPGTWQLGLANGLAGVLAGLVILRGIRFLFGLGRGMEGLGLGDADLMMMAGAFMGWQLVIIAFFVSVFPALVLALVWFITHANKPPPAPAPAGAAPPRSAEERHLPFGPALALGTLMTLFGWYWIGPHFQLLFFDHVLLLVLAVAGAFFLLVISFLLRLARGVPPPLEEK